MFSEFIFRQIWRVFQSLFLLQIWSLSEFVFVRFTTLRNSELDFTVFSIQKLKINKIGVETYARFNRMLLYQLIFVQLDSALTLLPLAILMCPTTTVANNCCFDKHRYLKINKLLEVVGGSIHPILFINRPRTCTG